MIALHLPRFDWGRQASRVRFLARFGGKSPVSVLVLKNSNLLGAGHSAPRRNAEDRTIRAPSIGQGRGDPNRDGDVNLYISPEAAAQGWFDRSRRVIFVNGMLNSPADHTQSARALSLLQGCPVIGVFNRTDGFWSDLGQCLTDKANQVGIQAQIGLSFESWARVFEALVAVTPGANRVQCAARLVADNPATLALFSLLAGAGGVDRRTTPIYSHSQGNLITSNALTALALALGPQALSGITVNSFGSPCRYWPPGISRQNNAFTFDPVSWLDLRADLTSSKVGFVAGHGFLLYLRNDAEFTVNRFRWGSFGLTANMDEAGLARHLVLMGNNPRRLRRIFERLRDAHYSDSDDVAYHYVRQASDALLRQIKATDPDLVDLLIELMEDGWTSSGEEEAILRLRVV